KAGEVIRQGEPILEITNPSRVSVEGYLPLELASRVKQGDQVEVQVDLPSAPTSAVARRFEGHVAFVNVRIEPVSKQVGIWAEIANPDHQLLDGLTATMLIRPAR